VNPANFTKTLERINKLADGIEKHAVSFNYGISEEYTKLKYDECTLNYQYKLLKQEEAEEQKAIKEMIREEQRVAKEYEKAIADAQQEENLYQNLLNKAQQELANASADQKSEFEAKIKQLEADLEESKLNNVRTMSMAQQTKRGHVYVISNIGSFGGDVYKIGLTRRLEPLDRVKELGDASVPFIFDVHALICVEDAPALESALHKKFTHKRVNAVNHRKEFFRTDLQSIQNAVLEIAGIDADFKTTIVADEYYQTQRLTGGNKHAEKHNAVEPLLEVSLI
jgi:multidrug efflux pump subunit AcrA (membrane-fusion protein)